jgi:hypothetical protein
MGLEMAGGKLRINDCEPVMPDFEPLLRELAGLVPDSEFYCSNKSCGVRFQRQAVPWRDCGNRSCCKRGGTHYPECLTCGKVMTEITNSPAVIWTGTLSDRYRSKENESYGKGDGFWAYQTRNTPSGKPVPVFLNDWQSVRRHARNEGCADPRELSNVMEPTESGKGLKNSVGMPGCEV